MGLHVLRSSGYQVLISQKKLPGNESDHSTAVSVVTARLHVHESVLNYTERRMQDEGVCVDVRRTSEYYIHLNINP